MGTSLTGTKIRDTYDALIKVSDNGALDGTLQVLTDGLGNNSALSLSTAGASVTGTLAVSGAATLSSTLGVTGAATLSSTLAVTGNLTVDTNTLFVDAANNNVGIGTTSPDIFGRFYDRSVGITSSGITKIQLNGSTYSGIDMGKGGTRYAEINASDASLDISTISAIPVVFYTNNAARMSITSGGDISFRDSSANEAFYWDASESRLGIGLTTPSDGIEVSNGGIKVSPNPTALAAGYNASFTTFYGEEVLQMLVNGNKAITVKGYNIPSSLHFYTYSGGASVERMRIDSSGNVGIGTASPATNLEVVGLTTLTRSSKSVLINPNFGSANLYSQIDTSIGMGLAFAPNGGIEAMRITSGGYLKASNTGSYHSASGSYHEVRSSVDDQVINYMTHTGLSPFGQIINFTQTTPNNSVNYFLYCADLSALRFQVRSNGGIANYQANDVNLSDERVKTDISPLGSYWDKIKAIEIVNFKYKDQTHDDFNIGVIAQQVESVAPEFVDVDGFDNRPKVISEEVLDEEGNVIQEAVYEEPLAEPLKAVYTADLYHAAIKVLQEAMARIEVLETELNALKQA